MAELRKATGEHGIVIVNVTQCPEGFVSKAYSGGWALEKAGVVAGGDMTTEVSHMLLLEIPIDVRSG